MRTVEISSMAARVSIHAPARRGYKPQIEARPWLELAGLMNDPVRDVRAVEISLYVDDRTEPGTARPACVGAIIRTRPQLSVVVGFPQFAFDSIWTLALFGHLKYADFAFTKPDRSGALVVSISFSTHPEE